MPATWQPRPEAESLHIISLTYYMAERISESIADAFTDTVGFLQQKLSAIDDVMKYRSMLVSRYFLRRYNILSSGIS